MMGIFYYLIIEFLFSILTHAGSARTLLGQGLFAHQKAASAYLEAASDALVGGKGDKDTLGALAKKLGAAQGVTGGTAAKVPSAKLEPDLSGLNTPFTPEALEVLAIHTQINLALARLNVSAAALLKAAAGGGEEGEDAEAAKAAKDAAVFVGKELVEPSVDIQREMTKAGTAESRLVGFHKFGAHATVISARYAAFHEAQMAGGAPIDVCLHASAAAWAAKRYAELRCATGVPVSKYAATLRLWQNPVSSGGDGGGGGGSSSKANVTPVVAEAKSNGDGGGGGDDDDAAGAKSSQQVVPAAEGDGEAKV